MNRRGFLKFSFFASCGTLLGGCMIEGPRYSREISPKLPPSTSSGSSSVEVVQERRLLPPHVVRTIQGKDVYVQVEGRERHGVGAVTLAIRQAGARVVSDSAAEIRFRVEVEGGQTQTASISGYPSTEHRFAAHIFVEGREVKDVRGRGQIIYVQLFQGAAEYARRLSRLGTANMGQQEVSQIIGGVVRDALKFLK